MQKFFLFLISFFYIQPSALLLYIPLTIFFLFALIFATKKISFTRAFFSAAYPVVCSLLVVFLTGMVLLPLIRSSYVICINPSLSFLIALYFFQAVVYSILVRFFLRIGKGEKIPFITIVCAHLLAAISVLTIYYLVWY